MHSQRFLFLVAVPGLFAQTPHKVDFARQVHPILSDACFACHGPDDAQRKANLRLDTREGASKVIKPGDAAASRLYQRVSHAKKALRMPPPVSPVTLTDAQVDTLKRWINEGAEWKTHWSYAPPKRPAAPEVKLKNWPKNDIDRFVLARLEKEGLAPSPEAEKATLLRRVSLDLTGLPPDPAELEAFLKDKSPDAYEKVVDRLLASPHYGERMAMPWLDLARYADTHGYHIDSHRVMWPWRDWVIGAYNKNLPFDQFTIWQLAGDLLPDATVEQKLASGFNRNHMINYEGGAIPEEYLAEYVVDRVEATSTTWLAATMGCARCHDHKYDPIKQKEFYQFFAFFNTVDEKGLDGRYGNADPFLPLPSPEQKREQDELKQAIEAREKVLDEKETGRRQEDWEKDWQNRIPEPVGGGLLAWYELDGNTSDVSGHFHHARVRRGDLTYSNGPTGRAAEFDGETLVEFAPLDASKPFSLAFQFRSSRKEGQVILGNEGFRVAVDNTIVLPRLKRGQKLAVYYGGRVWRTREVLVNGDTHHVTIARGGDGFKLWVEGKPAELETSEGAVSGRADGPLVTGNRDWPMAWKGRLDDLRIYARQLAPAEAGQVAVHYPMERLAGITAKRTKEQNERLRDYFLLNVIPDPYRQAYTELKQLKAKQEALDNSITTVMVMKEAAKPRETHVLARGDYQQPREKVEPGIPAAWPPLPSGAPRNRLMLARWLVDPEHPLTSRVAVNRYWQMYFGTGLVKTTEDFGSQGEQPSHPELLDWLATEFVRTGWDIKAMQRLLVTSATYRQSSRVTPALHERDPENRLLARGPRFRIQAEMVRDNALAASGLLNGAIGGPSVLPYQPAGIWEEIAYGDVFTSQTYVQDHGDKLYRRGMYTFWKRTAPPATLNTFDAPDREKCTARRPVTNTPLQALALLNDPTFIEASRALAQRVLTGLPKASADAHIRRAFLLATARVPNRQEMQVLRTTLKRQMETYSRDGEGAKKLVAIGESPADSNLDVKKLAAWTNLCSVILNLDETVTKE